MTESSSNNNNNSSNSRNRGNKGNSGRFGRRKPFKSGRKNVAVTSNTYESDQPDLKQHVFDLSTKGDVYAKRWKKIKEYIGKNFQEGADILQSLENKEQIQLVKPTLSEDADPDDPVEKIILQEEVKLYIKRARLLKTNINKAYSLIIGQCTDTLIAKLEERSDFGKVKKDMDAIGLIKIIDQIMARHEDTRYDCETYVRAQVSLWSCVQNAEMSDIEHLERLKAKIDTLDSYGITLGNDPCLLKNHDDFEELDLGNDEMALADVQQHETIMEKVREDTRDRLLGYLYIKNADKARYGSLLEELDNAFTRGKDEYPRSLTDAYSLCKNYRKFQPKANKNKNTNDNNNHQKTQVTFAQSTSGKSGNTTKHRCGNCGKIGHPTWDCPQERNDENVKRDKESREAYKASFASKYGTSNVNSSSNTKQTGAKTNTSSGQEKHDADESKTLGSQFFQVGKEMKEFSFLQMNPVDKIEISAVQSKELDLRNILLADNESTCDLFCNEKYVTNIRKAPEPMHVNTNGGELIVEYIADFSGYPKPVWFHPKAITNIISYANLADNYRMLYDNRTEDAFLLFKQNGDILKLTRSPNGIYYHDLQNRQIMLLNQVSENELGYTQQELEKARLARKLYGMIGYPSIKDYKVAIKNNLIHNCPVQLKDVTIAEKIYGKDIAALKGKTTRTQPLPVNTDVIPVPKWVHRLYHDIVIGIDIFFVNRIPFITSLSKGLYLTTVAWLNDRSVDTVCKALKDIINIYNKRGFRVATVCADREFEPTESYLGENDIVLNTTGANDHVPAVERNNRTIKERVRAAWSRLPYQKCLPKIIVHHMVMNQVTWLNNFPRKGGCSRTLPPRFLLTGTKLDYKIYCQTEFGQYVQTHEDTTPRNSIAERTQGAICLGPTGNLQGSHYFMSLQTGSCLVRSPNAWTEIPITNEVINRVIEIGEQQKAIEGLEIATNQAEIEEHLHDVADIAGVYDPTENFSDDDDDDETDDDESESEPEIDYESEDESLAEVVEYLEKKDGDLVEEFEDMDDKEMNVDEEEIDNTQQPNATTSDQTIQKSSEPTRKNERIRNKPKNYEPSMSGQKYENAFMQVVKHIANKKQHISATNYSLKSGEKKFGDKAKEGAMKEMEQLHYRNTFVPVEANGLTRQERNNALESLIFLKEKKDGTIKGRACADGRKQRKQEDYVKGDSTSPTVSLESVLITAVIDAKEDRDVAVIDIPNAFIQTEQPEEEKVIMKLRGRLAELMVLIAPEIYSKYVVIENGVKVLYVRLLNALYGTLKAALLFCQKLVRDLEAQEFIINQYDLCVANKIINGKQMTLVWHVDDMKISHEDPQEVTIQIEYLRKRYASDGIGEMKVSRGKVHDYLGMTLDFRTKGEVHINMTKYIEDMLQEFPEEINKSSPTPAGEHLWKVNQKDPKLLSEEKKQSFHTFTAKGLFVCKRARPDIQTAIAFLSTRVQQPDQDDWKKLQRMMQYLRGTSKYILRLSADNI